MIIADQWLSQFFNPGGAHQYFEPFDVVEFPKGFISAKIGATDIDSLNELMQQDFRIIDTLLCFEQKAINTAGAIVAQDCRFAEKADMDQVATIAQHAFDKSRFYTDQFISDEVASKIKKEWVNNYFLGMRGTHMVVTEDGSKISGFMLLINNVIDLIATSVDYQRTGVASKMISFANGKIGLLKAGTQSANFSSISLYKKSNFTLEKVQFVLHKHV